MLLVSHNDRIKFINSRLLELKSSEFSGRTLDSEFADCAEVAALERVFRVCMRAEAVPLAFLDAWCAFGIVLRYEKRTEIRKMVMINSK